MVQFTRYGFAWLCIHHAITGSLPLGYPIRSSTDHRICAPPRGFSQLVATFFAVWLQGIHHEPVFTWPYYASFSLLHATYSLFRAGIARTNACTPALATYALIAYYHVSPSLFHCQRSCAVAVAFAADPSADRFATDHALAGSLSPASAQKTAALNGVLWARIRRFEPLTYGLAKPCSSQLSYIPQLARIKNGMKKKRRSRRGDP